MASQYLENNRLPTSPSENDALENDPRAGLTSDVETLLAIFESIERSIADGSPTGKLDVTRQVSMWMVGAEHKKSQGTVG